MCITLHLSADLQAVTPGNIMVKYADDTYLVIPACNIDRREREISNIETCLRVNNLTLNQSKSAEIVFTDSRKRSLVQPPPPLQGIARVTSLKVLGVTVTKKLSFTEHVWMTSSTRVRGPCMPSVPAFTWHVRSTSSAGLSVSRHLKAHLRCSSVVGLFDNASRLSFVELLILVCGSMQRLSRNLLTTLMNDCFLKFGTVHTTSSMNCCHSHLTLNTTSGKGVTT